MKIIKPIVFTFFIGTSFINTTCITKKSVASSHITEIRPKVSNVPTSLGFDKFYKKYLDASGIAILSSAQVPDTALYVARDVVNTMLTKVPQIIPELKRFNVRVSIMAANENATDIPEHRDLNKAFPETDWNARGRGYGSTPQRPATSCAEENILCYSVDRYKGENILIHEFAHTIHSMGLHFTETNFDKKLQELFFEAKEKGLWKNTYAISSINEYWAEGVQTWFNANMEVILGNGIHNEINTNEELKIYDPKLYEFIAHYFNKSTKEICCSCK